MTLLCFVLDLQTLAPPLLSDLKESLLQLANLFALSSEKSRGREQKREAIFDLEDRIGLCYIQRNSNPSLSNDGAELKIAYRPGERFSIRDFHHAVNNLPLDAYMPEMGHSMVDKDVPLKVLFGEKALYEWGSDNVLKKVIIISTSVLTDVDTLRSCLVEAAEQCIMVEFIVLESEEPEMYHRVTEKVKGLTSNTSDLENCLIRSFLPEKCVYHGLVKRWLQELRCNFEEPLQAVFMFKNPILGSAVKIYCNMSVSCNLMVDSLSCCQTCRCHGYPIDITIKDKSKKICPMTFRDLAASDLVDYSVKVGEKTVLFFPSFEDIPQIQLATTPINFNVIGRTILASFSEGLTMGTSYFVTPSCHEIEVALEECDKTDLNVQIFHGLCGALYSLDQGLICSSNCDVESMRNGPFQCYYLLQPSDKGPMLLRRVAGSEEILPFPDMAQATDFSRAKQIQVEVHSALLKIEEKIYNPIQYERGFHSKLNWLVKQSVQFGINFRCVMR